MVECIPQARSASKGHLLTGVARLSPSLVFHALLLAICLCDVAPSPVFADEIRTFFLMDQEPEERPATPAYVLQPELVPLWRKALTHSESELKRQAADAVARAKQLGHDEANAAAPELVEVLLDEQVHPAARHAAAHALIVLDHRAAAQSLFDVSQRHGKDLRQLVEPALARWEFEEIQPIWRRRIETATTPRRDLLLAVQGLGQVRDAAGLSALLALTMNGGNPADIRLAAARAAGRITDQGFESQAEQLSAGGRESVLDRLCAVHLIAGHQSNSAVGIQQSLATDPEPAVAGAALRSLFRHDPELVLPLAESALESSDANIRRVGIETYVELPAAERMQTLALRLNDPHPGLRGLVRESFFQLSKDVSRDPVIRQASIAILNGDDWRGQEQAALLLAALDEKSIAPRLIELLDSPRPEVMIASAWSLKQLAIAETAEPVLAFAKRRAGEPRPNPSRLIDDQLAHLHELLGVLKYAEALPYLKTHVPKIGIASKNARPAAIWSLGVILEGKSDEALASQLMGRVLDDGIPPLEPPEMVSVRRISALGLGKLQAKEHLAGMKELIGGQVDSDLLDLALRWAVLRISGEDLPIVVPPPVQRTGWFLEPLPAKN